MFVTQARAQCSLEVYQDIYEFIFIVHVLHKVMVVNT